MVMTEHEFDDIVRARLRNEIQRRGLSYVQLPKIAGREIAEMLDAKKPLLLEDLDALCATLGLDLFWIASNDYTPSKTVFRNLTQKPETLEAATEMENVFLCVMDYFQPAIKPAIPAPRTEDREYLMLIAEVLRAVEVFRKEYGNDPLDIPNKLCLPILACPLEGFDAFLLGAGERFAVCLNEKAPPSRIRFSLFHELAHFLFHRDEEFAVEEIQPRFYDKVIRETDLAEFVANKFAQYLIIPIETAEDLWQRAAWSLERLDCGAMQLVLDSTGASIDVLAHCLYDAWRAEKGQRAYKSLHDFLTQELTARFDNRWVRKLFSSHRAQIADLLGAHQEDFSVSVLEDIGAILHIPITASV